MKKITSIGLSLLLVPAMTMGIGAAAYSQEQRPGQSTDQQQRSVDDSMHPSGSGTAQEQRMGPRSSEDITTSGRKLGQGGDSMVHLSSRPSNAFNADELIGTNLKSAKSDEDIGEISDLIIDQNGQVVAVVVGVGGFLGMGQKNVAISWDSLERTRNEDGDGYTFHVNETESSLRSAPEYKN